jgi:hypothetical protein
MKRILLMAITTFVSITFLPSPTVQTQQPEEDQFPKMEDYPEAGANCKFKQQLAPWLGTPGAGPGKYRCLLTVYNCKTRQTDTYRSLPRDSETFSCDDYEKKKDELAKREICCDQCERPRPRSEPWFDKGAPCASRERGTYSSAFNRRNPNEASVSISICGEVIRYVSETPPTGDGRPVVTSFDVCCEEWRKARGTQSPCDARRDLDCDGVPNERDASPIRAQVTREGDDFVSEGGITGIPFWKQIHEALPRPTDCKDCKWELVRVQYTCRNIPRQGRFRREINDAVYEYEATWNCPNTGKSEIKKETATMQGLYCPRPPNRTWP